MSYINEKFKEFSLTVLPFIENDLATKCGGCTMQWEINIRVTPC